MDCPVCGKRMVFINTDSKNGLIGHMRCSSCTATVNVPPEMLEIRKPVYRCVFDNGESLDIRDDGELLLDDKVVETFDDLKRATTLLLRSMVAIVTGR